MFMGSSSSSDFVPNQSFLIVALFVMASLLGVVIYSRPADPALVLAQEQAKRGCEFEEPVLETAIFLHPEVVCQRERVTEAFVFTDATSEQDPLPRCRACCHWDIDNDHHQLACTFSQY